MTKNIVKYGSYILAYGLLSLFALIMLFPFIYMISTSLKNSSDVFHVPPRLLPYSAEKIEFEGTNSDVYVVLVDGVEREMVLIPDQRKDFGIFTTQENINPDTPNTSTNAVRVALDEATKTEDSITLQRSNGRDVSFDVYDVPVNGEIQRLILVSSPKLDKLVDPNNPDIVAYDNVRNLAQAEFVDFRTDNYRLLFGEQVSTATSTVRLSLARPLINTMLVTFGVVIGQLITSIMGGYAFSRVQFAGRNTLFVMYLGSIMIPFVVLIIPMYRLMVTIGWQNQIVSLIVPWIFSAYGTFLIRQAFITIPKEIEEAALMDGASRWRILWTIFVPLSRPAIATLAVFSFLYAWNSFLWPLLIIGEGNEPNHVLTLSLIRLQNAASDEPNLLLTSAAVAILPPIIAFIFAQRYFIEGVTSSGVKG
jgi:multiple sugar transport system permease protein